MTIGVLGEALIDRIERDGEFSERPGGSPYNVAVGLGRLDIHTAFLGRLSSDGRGELLRNHLVASGVDASLAPVGPEPTAVATVTVVDGQPAYEFDWESTADRLIRDDELPHALPPVLHVGSVALALSPGSETVIGAARRVAAQGGLVSVDLNVRPSVVPDRDAWQRAWQGVVATAALIKLSDEDLGWLEPGAVDKAVAAMTRRFSLLAILTRGERGAEAWRGGVRIATVDAHRPAPLVDTVGAGDAFMAAMLAWLDDANSLTVSGIAGLDAAGLEAMLDFAARAAAIACSRAGADPPHRSELE